MKTFLEYIMLNYTLFLGSAIVILLAIIGYYADKTNFGQGKNKDQNIDKDEELNIEEDNVKFLDEQIEDESKVESEDNVIEQKEIQVEPQQETFEETFEKFDKEFNEILPEKEIIDDELLDEIESLSFDKTQKIDLSDIPDLDDVELPKIKNLEPEEEDIWKF